MPRFERRSGGGGFRGGGRGGGGGSWGGGRDRGGGYDMPKPVKPGEEYDVEISEVGSKGDGIARVKNFVVFVAGVKQGEKCKIRIKEVMNRFAIGEKVVAGSEAAESEGGKAEAESDAKAEDVTEEEATEAEESEEE
ncbi:MAG TPA: TRAM domain-containing protein [archaeon]|nr:TRAM domain-containing protein [archaeon]